MHNVDIIQEELLWSFILLHSQTHSHFSLVDTDTHAHTQLNFPTSHSLVSLFSFPSHHHHVLFSLPCSVPLAYLINWTIERGK